MAYFLRVRGTSGYCKATRKSGVDGVRLILLKGAEGETVRQL